MAGSSDFADDNSWWSPSTSGQSSSFTQFQFEDLPHSEAANFLGERQFKTMARSFVATAATAFLPFADEVLVRLASNATTVLNEFLDRLPEVANATATPLIDKVKAEAQDLIWNLLKDLMRPILLLLIMAQVCSTLVTIVLLKCGGKVREAFASLWWRNQDSASPSNEPVYARAKRPTGYAVPLQTQDTRASMSGDGFHELLAKATCYTVTEQETGALHVATPVCPRIFDTDREDDGEKAHPSTEDQDKLISIEAFPNTGALLQQRKHFSHGALPCDPSPQPSSMNHSFPVDHPTPIPCAAYLHTPTSASDDTCARAATPGVRRSFSDYSRGAAGQRRGQVAKLDGAGEGMDEGGKGCASASGRSGCFRHAPAMAGLALNVTSTRVFGASHRRTRSVPSFSSAFFGLLKDFHGGSGQRLCGLDEKSAANARLESRLVFSEVPLSRIRGEGASCEKPCPEIEKGECVLENSQRTARMSRHVRGYTYSDSCYPLAAILSDQGDSQ